MKKRPKHARTKDAKRIKRILIWSILIIGIVFLLDASTAVTGNVVSDSIGQQTAYIIGIIFALIGVFGLSREIARTGQQYDEYRMNVANVLQDYKESPSKKKAVMSAREIDKITRRYLGNSVQGVYSEGDEAEIITGKKPVPVKFADEKEGKNLVRALARIALQNNPRNEENIRLGRGVDVKREVKKFEKQ